MIIRAVLSIGFALFTAYAFGQPSDSGLFDSERLPKAYKGINYGKFLATAKNLIRETEKGRGDYETTAEYKARQDAVNSRAAQLGPFPIAFWGSGVSVEYDADSKQGWIDFGLDKSPTHWDGDIELTYKESVVGSYIGSNAFGARRRIDRVDSVGLAINYTGNGVPANVNRMNLSRIGFSAAPKAAKAVAKKLAVVYFVKLRPPILESMEFESNRATVLNPTEGKHRTDRIFVAITGAMVYNFSTGEIYKKFDLTNPDGDVLFVDVID